METFKSFESQLYGVNDSTFEDIALRLFRFQASHNTLYRQFLDNLHILPDKIHSIRSIPFMPISFFKRHTVKTGNWPDDAIFRSSGTTRSVVSSHHIYNLPFYRHHAVKCFEHFFGSVKDHHFLALLPGYLERNDSSLVAMIDHFVKASRSAFSGFYLHNRSDLLSDLEKLRENPKKPILWGVTFALMDLAESHPDLSHCLVFETGGMKGKRAEITRPALHKMLKHGLRITKVYSEYGMTELLSQAYTDGSERFSCPPWMKIIGRDLSDPRALGLCNETAGLNVIDLANWHSVAFIETEDLGKVYENGSFEVLGRVDNTDIRGCNLMVG